jgi:chromosome segregation ATPase
MQKIITTIVLVLLVAVAVYFAFVVNKVNARMDELNSADSLHVANIDRFDRELHDLDLQFIGRGKHIQQFQTALANMDEKLTTTRRQFRAKVDSLGLIVNENQINTEAALTSLKTALDETSERLTRLQRETNRSITDLQTALSRLNREYTDLEARVKTLENPPVEDSKKKKR